MTYKLIKRVIENGNFDKEDLFTKVDTYYYYKRITQEQYEELAGILNA